jgi:hypothetical protein
MKTLSMRMILLALGALLTGCATQAKYDYSAVRQSTPSSILVLPPLNMSPDVRAPYSMMATVTSPLAEAGYYVFPVALVDQTFRENGMTNPGEAHDAPPAKLAEVFGADAVLYITVNEYGAKYMLLDSQVIVSASARLVDLRNGQLLWEGKASASNAEGRDNSGGGITAILIGALVRQVANNLGDQGYPVARMTSYRLLSTRPGGLLPGPRSPEYQKVVGK